MSKNISRIVLPVAGAALGGYALGPIFGGALGSTFGSAAPAVGAGLGAGVGGTAGSLVSGQKFGDALKTGAISGLGSGVLSALGGGSLPEPGAGAPGGASAGAVGGAGSAASGTAASGLPIDLSMIPEGGLASVAQEAGIGAAPSLGSGFGSASGTLADLGLSPGQIGLLNNAVSDAGTVAPGFTLPSGTGLATDLGINMPAGGTPTGIGTAVLDQPSDVLLGGTLANGGGATAPALNLGAPAAGAFDYSGSTIGKILNSLGLPQNAVTETIAKNPNLLLAGGGLAANMLLGNRAPEGTDELKALAEKANQRGDLYRSYLQNGTLPPGAQAGLTQATEAAKAAIRSKYASLNMSGSSAEQQELNDVDSRAQAQGFQMASNLLNTGVQESGLSANLYRALLGLNAQRDANTGRAISSFAAALNG